MNTVDALKDLYKTLCGKDYAGDPNPTDAEMIKAIAKDASTGGGSGSGSGPVIKLAVNTTDGTATADPLAAGLSLTDLSDATLEMYMTDGDLEALAGIYKLCGVTNTLSNVIQMIGLTSGPDVVMPIVLEYNSDTGEVTFVGNGDSGIGDAEIVNPGIPGEGDNS